jgi:hypothetical protein
MNLAYALNISGKKSLIEDSSDNLILPLDKIFADFPSKISRANSGGICWKQKQVAKSSDKKFIFSSVVRGRPIDLANKFRGIAWLKVSPKTSNWLAIFSNFKFFGIAARGEVSPRLLKNFQWQPPFFIKFLMRKLENDTPRAKARGINCARIKKC